MADEVAIIAELGDDADLLLAPDEWLENERRSLQQKLSLIAEELDDILRAQRIKRQLQQRNLVAVRCIEKEGGQPSDVIIKICSIPDALSRLAAERCDQMIPADIARDNAEQQIVTWRADGYDVDIAERLSNRRRRHG